MSALYCWSYALTRIHARHGERLDDADWRRLEASPSAAAYLGYLRQTGMVRFIEAINAHDPPHRIEATLRAAWRAHVAEVAAWAPETWRPAILWVRIAPDLPMCAGAARDDTYPWLPDVVAANNDSTGLATVANEDTDIRTRWAGRWLALLPRRSRGDERLLQRLNEMIRLSFVQLEQAPDGAASRPSRQELEKSTRRLFRQHGDSPVAAFFHLVLIALDLERLRGGLLRRHLFGPEETKEAA